MDEFELRDYYFWKELAGSVEYQSWGPTPEEQDGNMEYESWGQKT